MRDHNGPFTDSVLRTVSSFAAYLVCLSFSICIKAIFFLAWFRAQVTLANRPFSVRDAPWPIHSNCFFLNFPEGLSSPFGVVLLTRYGEKTISHREILFFGQITLFEIVIESVIRKIFKQDFSWQKPFLQLDRFCLFRSINQAYFLLTITENPRVEKRTYYWVKGPRQQVISFQKEVTTRIDRVWSVNVGQLVRFLLIFLIINRKGG